jgi:hypothetical protein
MPEVAADAQLKMVPALFGSGNGNGHGRQPQTQPKRVPFTEWSDVRT